MQPQGIDGISRGNLMECISLRKSNFKILPLGSFGSRKMHFLRTMVIGDFWALFRNIGAQGLVF